ncbi:MAG TPA: TolC family protein [Vicinamibacterales bacterium]|nr:TolC family protein [Vicinamibacterales bacterium]
MGAAATVSNTGVQCCRWLLASLAVVLLSAGTLEAQPAAPSPAPLTLQSAFQLADEHNRTLTAARLGRAVDLAGIGVARQRPNPEASFEAARDTPHEIASLAFPLELGGKRARRIDLANATLARTTADLAVQSLDVRRTVRLAYYQLVAATAQVQITSELRGFAERTRNAARDRFESGAAPRLEALQAELLLAQADNDTEAARGRQAAARTLLNTALGRAADTAAEPTDPFDGGVLPPDPAAIIAAGRDIAALDREIDEAVAREHLARAMRHADPTVSGGVLFDARPEFTYGWRAGVAVGIPLFTRRTAEVQVETARVTQLRAQRDARLATLTGEATAAATRAEAARRQYLRYRDEIIPQLATMEAMAEDSYRSGQTNLTAFLQALQAAREVRLRATDAGLEYQTALADLERALGGPIQ